MKKTVTIEASFEMKIRGKPPDRWRETVSDKEPIWTSMEQAVSLAKAHQKQCQSKARLVGVVMTVN